MTYRWDYQLYRRRFLQPLQTHHGLWEVREGILLRLMDDTGREAWGEIAPLPWFGSETLAEAVEFCRQLPGELSPKMMTEIPEHLPACQFGFAAAWETLQQPGQLPVSPVSYSALLPAGERAFAAWEGLYRQGYRTLKWKIAVDGISQELRLFQRLVGELPGDMRLRLDANGGLTVEEAQEWLTVCDGLGERVEFLEQPLAVEEWERMQCFGEVYQTAIALDESVATFSQLKSLYLQGWRGIFVVKPCIFGFPFRLREFCQAYPLDLVFSSVFETEVGRSFALGLAAELSQRPVGFGVHHWFRETDGMD